MKKSNTSKLILIIGLVVVFSFVMTKLLVTGNILKLRGSINRDNLIVKESKYVRFELKNTPQTIIDKVNSNIKVKKNGNIKSNSDNLATGDILESEDGDEELTIYVLADVNKDGDVGVNDAALVYNHIKGTLGRELTREEFYSADYTEDGKVNINDVSKIYNERYKSSSIHKVNIKMDMNGGFFMSTNKNTPRGIDDSESLLTNNGSTTMQTILYGEKLGSTGLFNWNNPNYVYIMKNGYVAKTDAEWINTDNNKTYSQWEQYSASDFCDASAQDCTVTLKVNWTNKIKIDFVANGGNLTTTSKEVDVNGTYGELPTPEREGYTFIGWYDNSKCKNADIYYRDSPFRYYADMHEDLYALMKYDTNRLYSHYITWGKDEGRRVSQYVSTDEVDSDRNLALYAGWMPTSLVATFNPNGGTVTKLNSSWTYSKSGKDLTSDGNQLMPNMRYDYIRNNVLVGSPNYGNLPTVTRNGYIFMGWYDCTSTAKYDSGIYYYASLLIYYADSSITLHNSDLYERYGYNQIKLLNHYMNAGRAENRRTSQIVSSDEVHIVKNKTVRYCAGWIQQPTKSRHENCGVQSKITTCTSYKTCQTAACGTSSSSISSNSSTRTISVSSKGECGARGGVLGQCNNALSSITSISSSPEQFYVSAKNTRVATERCKEEVIRRNRNSLSGTSYTYNYVSEGWAGIYVCHITKTNKQQTKLSCNCTISSNNTSTPTVKSCQDAACGCASSNTTVTYNECYHW